MSEKSMDIWISGASSGIGLALAKYWSSRGNRVFVSSRSAEKSLGGEMNNPLFIPVDCDVTDTDSVTSAIKKISSHTGKLDMLVCSAGLCHYFDKGKINTRLAQDVIDTNFMGTVNCIAAAMPLLQQSHNNPLIAGISSLSADVPFPRASVYGASKAALNYFLRSLRSDLQGSGIRVAIIHPGFIETPMTARNDFSMPFLMSAEKAADYIGRKLAQGKTEIRFPAALACMTRLAGLLPEFIRIKLSPIFSKQVEQ